MKSLITLAMLLVLQAPLTNKEVIELVKAGLSPEVIVAKIKASSVEFDTSTKALSELKAAGVPDSIIVAMLEPRPASSKLVPLHLVKRIFVGEMGKSDDSERFRMLLREKLAEKGFTVVRKEEEADALLTGSLATQLDEGTTKARASVELVSDGQVLWEETFGVRMAFGLGRRDSVKLRAEDVANGLADAVKKARKKN